MEQATQYLECFFVNQNDLLWNQKLFDQFARKLVTKLKGSKWSIRHTNSHTMSWWIIKKVNGGRTVKHLSPPPHNKRQRQSTPRLSGHSLSAISQATLGLTDSTISFVTQHDYCCTTHSFSDMCVCGSCIWKVFQKVRERTNGFRWLCL